MPYKSMRAIDAGAVFLALLALGTVQACKSKHEGTAFCAMHEGQFSDEPMFLDPMNRVLAGTDSSFEFKVSANEYSRGFVAPFPLMLPTVPIEKLPERWVFDGYEFTTSNVRTDTDWVLINARAVQPVGNVSSSEKTSSVLYSASSGVVALRYSKKLGDRTLISAGVSCGTRQLKAADFR